MSIKSGILYHLLIGSTQTMDLGKTKELTDTNGVLQYYESFNYTKDKVTFKHEKGSNKMKITVASDAIKETVSVTEANARNNKLGKYINTRSVQTNFVLSPIPANQATHQRLLVSYGYNDPKYMRISININLHGDLELAKKDDKGNFVPNVKFKVSYNEDMSNPIGTYTTESNGKVTVKDLNPKAVYIQEVEVPENLILDTTVHEVTIKPNDVTNYTATNNWKQGRIKVIKKDEETGKIIKKAGTVFDIYNSQNTKVISITTNGEGVATSELLDYGTYYVKEKNAPDGYTVKVEISNNIDIKEDGKTYEVAVTNVRVKGSVTISKEDDRTGKTAQGEATLEGAIYGVYARNDILDPADGSIIYSANTKIGELVTDEDANASMNELYLGEYYVKEIEPSLGYNLDNTEYDFRIEYEGQDVNIVTKKVDVKERVVSQAFQIIKVSSDEVGEAELLEGAEFIIKSKKDIEEFGSWEKAPIAKNANGEVTATLITDSKGYAISERLPFGQYVVRETKVPDEKYKVEDFEVTISKDSSEPQVWRVFNDTSFSAVLAIVKKDAETGKTVQIGGARFRIKNLDTNEYFGYWEWNPLPHYVDNWTTDKTGTVMTGDKLKAGSYQLEEIESPNGYLISSEPISFKITSNTAYETLPDNQTIVITINQEDISAKGKINIEKRGEVLVDFKDGKFIYETKGLANAVYEIIAKEDILDPSNDGTIIHKKGETVDTITTNQEGKAISKELILGEYSVREIQAPENFVLNEEIKDISLKYKDQNTAIVFDDISFINERQKVEVNVIKQDADTKVELQGAEFGLYAKEDILNNNGDIIVNKGQLIETVVSDQNGKVYFESDLPLANFEVKELKAPIGYYLSDEAINVDATYQGQDVHTINLEYVFKNDRLPSATVKVKKIDSLDRNKKLKNIDFNIAIDNKMSNIIATERTNEDGIAIFENLALGTYYIQESRQVDGYTLNDTIYKVEAKENEDVLTIECENKPVEMEFSKVDETGKNELPGAKIQILDKLTGEVIEEWVSTKEPHIIHYLTEGREYIMREIIAPSGYKIAEEIVFKAGDGQKVTMKDELKPVIQTGNETNYFLLISSIVISVIGLIMGIVILKRNKKSNIRN